MRFVRAFGTFGSAPGQFKEPWGVCVAHDMLVVSEARGLRIQVFAPDEEHAGALVVQQVCPLERTPGAENHLRGCAASRERVYVADISANTVSVFAIESGLHEPPGGAPAPAAAASSSSEADAEGEASMEASAEPA